MYTFKHVKLLFIFYRNKSKDQLDVLSFLRTFVLNNIMENTSINQFKKIFLNLFRDIILYNNQQEESFKKRLVHFFSNKKQQLIQEFKLFDENGTWLISFVILKKIINDLEINIKNDLLEYLIYMMKKSEHPIGLKQLDYYNFIELINNNNYSKEELESYKDDEESIIEIKNEDYIKTVNDIVFKMKNFLKKNNQKIDNFFKQFIFENNKLDLEKFVDILKTYFKIELNQIEIFCLFSKYKFDNDNNSNEEIINYQSLKMDVENNSNNNVKYEISNSINETIGHNNEAKNSIIESIFQVIKNKNYSFERLVFPFHTKMKLKKNNDNNYERLLDIETFKLMLKTYQIYINNNVFIHLLVNTESLFEDGKINIDILSKNFPNDSLQNDYYDFDE